MSNSRGYRPRGADPKDPTQYVTIRVARYRVDLQEAAWDLAHLNGAKEKFLAMVSDLFDEVAAERRREEG